VRRLYNLREYHRPTDLDEAKRLLHRKGIRTVPLAGGSSVIGEATPDLEAVVDLDGLKLDFIEYENGALYLGAMLRLQTIVEKLADISDVLLADAARRTAGWHIRNMATVGGVLAGGDIHSPLSIALAALKARVKIYEQAGEMPLWADLSKEIRRQGLKGKLITAISLNLPEGRMGASYQQVARTPADRPIVSAASVVYESGDAVQATTAVGGLLNDILVLSQKLDRNYVATASAELAAEVRKTRTPEASYQSDFLGSAEYRRDVAPRLAQRALLAALERLNQSLA
jgi:CO/xanthine dehydrogenase FAD-binding subunit